MSEKRSTQTKEAAGIYEWVDRATKGLCDPLDRRRIKKELMAHYQDRCACYESTGLRYAEASKKAVAVLGSPEETGALLRSIHKPWLALALHLTRLLLAILAAVLLVNLIRGNIALDKLGFLSSGEKNRLLGLAPYSGQSYNLMAKREASCDEEMQFGAFRISLGASAIVLQQVTAFDENGTTSKYIWNGRRVLLHLEAAPWHNLNDQEIERSLRAVNDQGEEVTFSFFSVNRITPWRIGVFLQFDTNSRFNSKTKWVDFCLEHHGQTQRMRITFSDWEPADWDFPALENETEAAEKASHLLAGWDAYCLVPPQRLSGRPMRPARTEGGKLRMSVPWGKQELYLEDPEKWGELYERRKKEQGPGWKPLIDSNEYACAFCVLELQGDPRDLPMIPGDMRNRLSLFRLTETGEREEIQNFFCSDPQWYADAGFWALRWMVWPEAERYELCYTQTDGSILRLELTLEEENRP